MPVAQAGAGTTGLLGPADFARAVLQGLGIAPTTNNVTAMQVWMAAEEGSPNNPLNVRQSNGSFNVATQQDGIAQTVSVINQSNMAPIKAALQQSVSPANFAKAAAATPWDANRYAGSDFLAGLDGPLVAWGHGVAALGKTADTTPPGTIAQLGNDLTNIAPWTSSLGKILNDLTQRTWWVRIGEFTLGAALFIVGLVGFLATSEPGQKVVGTAEKAAVLA